MITCNLYEITDGYNVLNKTLGDPLVLNGVLNGAFNVNNPSIRIKHQSDISNYNYAYISEVGTYYFIDDVSIDRNGYYVVHMSCDVLMTYKDEIKLLYGIVKSGVDSNPYMNGYIDSFDVRRTKTVIEFENNFNEDGEIILIASKGNSS